MSFKGRVLHFLGFVMKTNLRLVCQSNEIEEERSTNEKEYHPLVRQADKDKDMKDICWRREKIFRSFLFRSGVVL